MGLGGQRGERKVEGESSLSGVSFKDTNPIRSARALPLLPHLTLIISLESFPGGSDGKESACNAGDWVDPWVWKIPWRREWLPTPVFLPVKSHGQRSLVGYGPWYCEELDTTERLTHTHTHISLEALFPYR